MINNKIKKLEKDLIDTINKSDLPIAIACLTLNKILADAELALHNALTEENNAMKSEE